MRYLMIAAAAMLGACVPAHRHPIPTHTEAPPMQISGEWIEASDAAHKASISFADGAASGSTGCNRWSAQVDQSNGLRFGVGAATEMYCAEAMEGEQRLLAALEATRSAEEEGGMLTLKDANGEELMRFVRPAGAIEGVAWRRIDDEDANPHGATLTIEGARASGHAGCNRWFASVTREGDRLSFGQAGLTRMMCAEPAMAAEERFLAALQVTRALRMEGEELVFADHAGRDVARFRRER